jgi:hypothetical protein
MPGPLDVLFRKAPGVLAGVFKGQRLGRERQFDEERTLAKERQAQEEIENDLRRIALQEAVLASQEPERQAHTDYWKAYTERLRRPAAPEEPKYRYQVDARTGRVFRINEATNEAQETPGQGGRPLLTPQPEPPKAPPDPNIKFNVGNALRDDFQRLTAPYELARTGHEQMKVLALDDTGASDVNLLIAAAKVADPESVVREGEVAIQRIAASVAELIGAKWSQLVRGAILEKHQREKLVGAAGSRMRAHRANYERYRKQYGSLAVKYGGEEWDVVGDDPEQGAPPRPSPRERLGGLLSPP